MVKQKFLEDLGFLYLVVWENDYRNDKLRIQNNLQELINERSKSFINN